MAGKLVHFELPAQDASRARGFWSGLLGWEFQDSGMPDVDYEFSLFQGDESVAGEQTPS